MTLSIGVPKEIVAGENRVAITPFLIDAIKQLGCEILIEKNAGLAAGFADESYQNATLLQSTEEIYQADIVLKVQAPTEKEIALLKTKSVLIGMLAPYQSAEKITAYNEKSITSFSLEKIPRISRAQSMDVLTSQATVSGYKAVLLAANLSQRFFPMFSTAAGTIKPSQVFVIGAGVAGLQAIATARRLGAVVTAYDIRAAAREQVESLGAKMVDVGINADATGGYARQLTEEEKSQQENALIEHLKKQDVVITTAGIPGKPAPKILTQKMLDQMTSGSLIVDIMAEFGGNCELTQAQESINYKNILISGPVNLPSQLARDASFLYARNLFNFIKLFIKDGQCQFDWQDQILADCVLTHEGVIRSHV